jgi:hypothetical protein
MKQLTLMALVSLCLVLPAIGQSYAYHDTTSPTGGSTNTFPFGNSFGNNWRYQMTVPASSLPGIPVRFTEFAFAPSASGVFAVQDFQLRMGHATSLALSSVFASNYATPPVNLIDVQNGNYTFTATVGQWTDLGAVNGFDYDGVRPLLIEVRYRGFGTTPQGTVSIRSMTSSTNSNRVWANGSYPAPGPADPYAATVGHTPYTYGAPRVRLTYATTQLTLSGGTSPGSTVDLNLSSAADAGRAYQVASSLGTGPIPIGTRSLGLSPDALMVITVNGYLPTVFVNYAGVLDASGKAKAQILIPNNPVLTGIRVYSAFVTIDPAAPYGISNISNTATLSIL